MPKGVEEIEVFCVGGGGNGGNYVDEFKEWVNEYNDNCHHKLTANGGGGGGGYTITNKLNVKPLQNISISIGSATGNTEVLECIANSGNNGGSPSGGNGGSGGAMGQSHSYGFNGMLNWNFNTDTGSPGSDGADGTGSGSASQDWMWKQYGKGQGTTTRAFGESNGTLYSTGGYASGGSPGSANTGNGGYGGNSTGGSGGSGIAIIRWGY